MKNILRVLHEINNISMINLDIYKHLPGLFEEDKKQIIKNILETNLETIAAEIDVLLSLKIKNNNNITETKVYFDILKEIQSFLTLLEENKKQVIKAVFESNLTNIEKVIDLLLFYKIKNCKTIQDANTYFDILLKIESFIFSLAFNENIEISDKLREFIRYFDRLHSEDDYGKMYIFNRIKEGTYNLQPS